MQGRFWSNNYYSILWQFVCYDAVEDGVEDEDGDGGKKCMFKSKIDSYCKEILG